MSQQRSLSIDVFRGLAIAVMVFGNTSLVFEGRGFWADHAVDFGLTPGDLVAPGFIFAIALTYRSSFERSCQRHGGLAACAQFVRRYTCLVGIGFLFHPVFPASEEGIRFTWGTLASIGLAGLLTLPFVRLPRAGRLAVSLVTLVVYQVLLARSVQGAAGPVTLADLNLQDVHGGMFGGIAWFAMMLLCTAVQDDPQSPHPRRLLRLGLALCSAALATHLAWLAWDFPAYGGISKERMTASFVLAGAGCSALVFWGIHQLYEVRRITVGKSRFFQPLGKNSIFIFVTHPFLVLAAYLLLPADASDVAVFLASVANAGLAWGLAVWMDRRGNYIAL